MSRPEQPDRVAPRGLHRLAAGALAHALALSVAIGSVDTESTAPKGGSGSSLLSLETTPDRSVFVLRGDGPLVYRQQLSLHPPRLVLELPGVKNRIEAGPPGPGLGPVASISVAAYEDPEGEGTRVVFDLRDGYAPELEAGADGLRLRFERPAPAATSSQPPGFAGETSAGPHYVIGPEDLLDISVFEVPDLRSTVRVQGDGTISLPLVGVLNVSGLTEAELESRISEALDDRYVKNPQVSVFIKEHESKKISVIGAVQKPGTYAVLGERSLVQIISQAGGLAPDAGSDVLIIRNGTAGESERLRVDVRRLLVEGEPALNVSIRPGDVVHVLADAMVYVYIDGSVKNPGQIEFKRSRPLTLVQAIARAGGATDRANLRQVRIIRRKGAGVREHLVIDTRKIRNGKAQDIELLEGDIVVVPEALF